ncbi:hypothetical protein DN068_08450 [Taibaiella soli]|uniref:Uncharacterized protein n=1 Tax=Taibaiella soli TaxID=1649169 RepID=A0A2W2ADR7_9BACT|nr:hypothetical protein DN068_08450 [Taibaiella soli]
MKHLMFTSSRNQMATFLAMTVFLYNVMAAPLCRREKNQTSAFGKSAILVLHSVMSNTPAGHGDDEVRGSGHLISRKDFLAEGTTAQRFLLLASSRGTKRAAHDRISLATNTMSQRFL